MTKRVKLPASLGGAEVEAMEADPLPAQIHGVPVAFVRVPGVGWCGVPTRALTEVLPPLPPEPPDGSAFRVRFRDGATAVIERDDSAETAHGDRRWFSTAMGGGPASWEEVTAPDAMLTALAPVPEPVELPWHLTSINGWGRGIVRLAQDNPAAPVAYGIDDYTRFVSIAQAREMAAALLSAAEEAERAK